MLEEETLELSLEGSGLVGISSRGTTCAGICWHRTALCVCRWAGGLPWLLRSMRQKLLVTSVCPQEEGLPSSYGSASKASR